MANGNQLSSRRRSEFVLSCGSNDRLRYVRLIYYCNYLWIFIIHVNRQFGFMGEIGLVIRRKRQGKLMIRGEYVNACLCMNHGFFIQKKSSMLVNINSFQLKTTIVMW